MANTLTGLIPTIYDGLNTVSRELVGFIPAVARNSSLERAAKDQTVRVPVSGEATLAANTPATTAPDTGDHTDSYVDMTIDSSYHYPIRWNGEEVRSVGEANYRDLMRQRFAMAFRKLTNAIETDIAELYAKASRAYGTPATTPLAAAGELDDIAEVRRILEDNGCPITELQLVLDTAAMAKMRGYQSLLLKANEAGTSEFLRSGFISQGLEGFAIRSSAQVQKHTAGTGASYDTDGDAVAIGGTTIHVDTGTGTAVVGDVITFSGDTSHKYVVKTGFAGDGDMDVVIAEPGGRVAIADGEDMAILAAYRANMAFDRNAIQLATRLPLLPEGGDAAVDRTTIVDPFSGLAFEVALYPQYRQMHIEVAIAWGVEAIKPEHMALLLG